MFIEVTCDGGKALLKAEEVLFVLEGIATVKTAIVMKGEAEHFNCTETYQDVKKMLGMAITPRAETLALR